MSVAGSPVGPVPVPGPLRAWSRGRPTRAVWRNEAGGTTFAVGEPPVRYLKWQPDHPGASVEDEAARLRWARRWIPVPEVEAVGRADGASWLVTRAVDGRSAVDPRWLAEPATACAALGTGLAVLHSAVPIERCPFSWRTVERVADARRRLASGELPVERPVGPHPRLRAAHAVAWLEREMPDEDPVVCHGDPCAPNTLLADDGSWLALVDVGRLGVGDRWADLAVSTWSTEWNYGPGWDRAVFEAYGIAPDPDLLRYFRILWDVGP